MGITKNILRSLRRRLVGDRRFGDILAGHFTPIDDAEARRDLFARSVRLVEVEVHSFCNRVCWFCPNAFIDRRSETFYLDEAIYRRLLDDLADVDYNGVLTFSRYCEPFADEVFYGRLETARRMLPGACMHTNTNGDYLNDETLARAERAGLDRIYIQLYLARDEVFGRDAVDVVADRMRKRVPSVDFVPERPRPGRIGWSGRFGGMTVRMYARDFRAAGVNRCGVDLATPVTRTSPCFRPFTDLYVDYNAAVVPCCNLRSDYPPHAAAVLGTLDAEPGAIFRVYAGRKAAAWRRALFSFAPKTFPCEDCTFDAIDDTPVNRRRLRRLRERFASVLEET